MRRIALVFVLAIAVPLAACPDDNVDGARSNATPPTSKAIVPMPSGSSASSASNASNGTSSDAAAPAVITASLQGKSYVFPSAFVRSGTQNDVLVLSTAKLADCAATTPPDGLELSIELPAGPGGKHFAGQPLATSIELVSQKAKLGIDFIDAPFVTVHLETETWAKGDRVKGTFEFAETRVVDGSSVLFQGGGPFEAQACNVDSPLKYPGTASSVSGALKGTFGGSAFASKGAIAWLERDDAATMDAIAAVTFHAIESSKLDCASAAKDLGAVLRLEGHGGASSKQRFLGAAQPTRASYADPKAKASQRIKAIAGPAWIRFDAFELKEGGKASGAAYVASAPAEADPKHVGTFSGTFEALVCKKP